MTITPDAPQLKHEADRTYAMELGCSDEDLRPRDERIESQSERLYRPPAFLKTTTTPDQFQELADIFHKIREVNEEHVGELTMELGVYLFLAGRDVPVVERLLPWCRRYVEKRWPQFNPRDERFPPLKCERLREECGKIFGKLVEQNHTVNFLFLRLAQPYTDALLFEARAKDCQQNDHWSYHGPDHPANRLMAEIVAAYEFSLLSYYLDEFVDKIAAVDSERLVELSRTDETELRGYLQRCVDDIQEMRPLLVRNFNPAKTAISLGESLVLAWDWCVVLGIACISVHSTMADLASGAVSLLKEEQVKVGRDGILFERLQPWHTAATSDLHEGVNCLAVNAFVVELFHERLFSFYDKVDFDAIRNRAKNVTPDAEADDELIAMSCRDLAADDVESSNVRESTGVIDSYHVPKLRSQRLFKLLHSKLGCEVKSGKGSEITVFRPGGRKFVIGHHKRNDTVHSIVVKNMLNRLNIGPQEWFTAVYG